jgi:hypothetical protein
LLTPQRKAAAELLARTLKTRVQGPRRGHEEDAAGRETVESRRGDIPGAGLFRAQTVGANRHIPLGEWGWIVVIPERRFGPSRMER